MRRSIRIAPLSVLAFVFMTIGCKQPPVDAVTLGKQLFFDTILSGNYRLSCASCHRPDHAFSDTSAVSVGVFGRKGTRNTPSAMNVDLQTHFFWDGRASTLEQQALIPIANPAEMDCPVDSAVNRLRASVYYLTAFQSVYKGLPTAKTLAAALGAFQRSMETNQSPFDEWRINDRADAISTSAKQGYILFNGKAGCVRCHFGADFASPEFRNIGLYDGIRLTDSGRAAITYDPRDLGRFKIGPLRNIAVTAPYMHNGMFRTLREVIDYYNDPDQVVPHPLNRDTLLSKPLGLTEQERSNLEAFLLSLTDKRFAKLAINH